MIDANTIKSLLKGVDVEYKNLGEITRYEQPTKYLVDSTDYNDDFKIPVLTAGKTFILGYTNEIAGIYKARNNPVIIFDDFTTAHKWVNFDFKVKSTAMKIILSADEKKYHLKFVYYWLNTLPTEKSDNNHKRQWISNYANKTIPIPSYPIQNKIVNILDTFTALTTELTTELNARLKQYNYYRDKLLSFAEDEIEHKKLGEILVRTKGTKITANEMKKIHKDKAEVKIFAGGKTFAFVDYEDIPLKNINKEPSIIVKSRGIIEFEFYDKPFSHKNEMWSYHSKNKNINIKYIYYYLKNKEKFFQQIGSKMQMPQISISVTDGFVIPIPPLSKQKQIVEILDKFDTLTNSIAEGLPREIELRQKQYEYYRNLLLDFPKS